jgi:preprotein translocase subunit SecG
MFNFLLVIQALVSAAMVTVILMQRSEGGGLGVGGSPSGLMSARGAADFLTRATSILATLFVVLSIVLAGLATVQRGPIQVDSSAPARPSGSGTPLAPITNPGAPLTGTPPVADPLAGVAQKTAPGQAPAQQPSNGSVPIAQ